VAVDRREIIAWPATSRRVPRPHTEGPSVAACVPPRSVSTGQSRVFGPNITMLDGLDPYTVYNVCCRWKQLCGGDWHTAYFRVGTKLQGKVMYKIVIPLNHLDWRLLLFVVVRVCVLWFQ